MMITKYGVDNAIYMIIGGIIILFASYFSPWIFVTYLLILIGSLIILFTLWFFRDPERIVPIEIINDESIILSPADGKIVELKEIYEKNYLKTNSIQISIFLSPLDVHVNRNPMLGIVEYFKYNPGDYFVAYHPKSSELNEQSHIGVKNSFGKIFYKQITGILARRLVWDINVGDKLEIGKRFGMMKFGSRMDIFLPTNSEIIVKSGDKVIGGKTILAKLIKE